MGKAESIYNLFYFTDDPESLTYEEFRRFVKDRVENMDIDFHQRVLDAFNEFSDGDEEGIVNF